MAREIVVGNNPQTTGDDKFFPYVASSDGLQSSRGRTFDHAVLEIIRLNQDVLGISVRIDPRYRYTFL